MKVTGISPADLVEQKPPQEEGLSATQKDMQRLRYELFEKKRRQLLHELEVTAEALDDSYVELILTPKTGEDGATAEIESALEVERVKAEKMRARMKEETQKEVINELDKKQAFEQTVREKDEPKKRSPEAENQRHDEIKKKEEERMKEAARRSEIATKSLQSERERRREIQNKINEAHARVSKLMDEKNTERQAAIEERRRKMAEIASRNMRQEKAQEDKIFAKHDAELQRERDFADRRLQKQEVHSAKVDKQVEKFATARQNALDHLDKKDEERQQKWKDMNDKCKEAKTLQAQKTEEIAEKAKSIREKEVAKFATNRQTKLREKRQWIHNVRANLQDGIEKSVDLREKNLEENVQRSADLRNILKDIVQSNRDRIARSEECAREQTLAKIQTTSAKIDNMLQHRKEIIDFRTSAVKDFMVGKSQMLELKRILRDSSVKRANQILKDLDMPLVPTQAVKEGEDGEEQKK
eukprot:TRINITY_DN24538_c0_g1_i1.p1 TRINITY_DN24538_c0_g1~~TRINITY_DN24538_c0_g1_i1.p1  ORF type:complete len:526 (+),score=163.22 TRINITY_DN24538_c0_g1_i1:166-1578(+)